MKILNPITKKTGKQETIYINSNDIYVFVTDFGAIYLLREIKLEPGRHTWSWIPIVSKLETCIDISGVYNTDKVCSFHNAINRSINDLYCTVYQFNNFDELFKNSDKVKYKNDIKTIYLAKEEKEKE